MDPSALSRYQALRTVWKNIMAMRRLLVSSDDIFVVFFWKFVGFVLELADFKANAFEY